jgi:alpha-D-ribose 1-methylphosphonate 5-triphosphate synthase subunit PhnL
LADDDEETTPPVIEIVQSKKESATAIIGTIHQFFENLDLDIEDWKVSMEEFRDGTRLFVRFQVLVKKR